jgi:ATP-binding cassette subfamily F protein 3
LVIVSHDRHLIKTVADSLWLVADGRLRVFEGDLDDYQQWLRSRGKTASAAAKQDGLKRTPAAAPRVPPKSDSTSRRRLAELRREIGQVEKRIDAIAAELTLIETELCNDPMHGGLQARHADLTRDSAAMEARWLEIGTSIEAAEAEVGVPD